MRIRAEIAKFSFKMKLFLQKIITSNHGRIIVVIRILFGFGLFEYWQTPSVYIHAEYRLAPVVQPWKTEVTVLKTYLAMPSYATIRPLLFPTDKFPSASVEL